MSDFRFLYLSLPPQLHKGSVSARSKYCPLDLFSGCPQRQTRALEALVESPQNNFRLFRDQNYAFGDASNARFDDAIAGLFPDVPDDATDDARRRQAFCRLLVVALNKGFARAPPLRPDPRWPPQQTCQLHPSRCTCGSRHALDQGSVLSAVLCAQRLDQLDSRLANEKWTALNNNNAGDCPLDHAPDWVPEWAGREGRAPQESEREWSVRQVSDGGRWSIVDDRCSSGLAVPGRAHRQRLFRYARAQTPGRTRAAPGRARGGRGRRALPGFGARDGFGSKAVFEDRAHFEQRFAHGASVRAPQINLMFHILRQTLHVLARAPNRRVRLELFLERALHLQS